MKGSDSDSDERWMGRALELARGSVGMASPNPEAITDPVVNAAFAIIHTPNCATPRLRRATGATISIPTGYAR